MPAASVLIKVKLVLSPLAPTPVSASSVPLYFMPSIDMEKVLPPC